MNIIRAHKQHASAMIGLVEALLTELGGKRFVIDAAQATGFIEHAFNKSTYTAFLAFNPEGETIGMISAGESGAVYTGGTFGMIHEFYIDPAMRSKGIGKLLMEQVKQLAVERAWKRLEVGAPPYPEWKRTKQFYLREGFAEIGPRLRWIVDV